MGLIENVIRSGTPAALRFTEELKSSSQIYDVALQDESRSEYMAIENHEELPTDAVEHMNRFLIEEATCNPFSRWTREEGGDYSAPPGDVSSQLSLFR
ncbi:MAG: hypothetical protein U0V70_15225 [Terriglobia bacterium]